MTTHTNSANASLGTSKSNQKVTHDERKGKKDAYGPRIKPASAALLVEHDVAPSLEDWVAGQDWQPLRVCTKRFVVMRSDAQHNRQRKSHTHTHPPLPSLYVPAEHVRQELREPNSD